MNTSKRILIELSRCADTILSYVPGLFGCCLRHIIYRERFKACGRKARLMHNVSVRGFKNIELGNDICVYPYSSIFAESSTNEARIKIGNKVGLNRNVMVNADRKGEIIIEDNVLVGPNVVMRASGHKYEDVNVSIREQGHYKGRIVIKEGAWIGANAVILPNVIIGRGAVVGAGAVVTKDVDDFDIVGGVPAKKIGSRLKDRSVV